MPNPDIIVIQVPGATGPAGELTSGQKDKDHSFPVTLASNDDLQAKLGVTSETAPDTDTAAAGLNGRLQRIAQNVTASTAALTSLVGTKVTAITALAAGGAGIIGWLSQIWEKLNGTLAVSAAALPLPAGAATAANQATGNASLAAIDTKLASTLTDAQLRASAVPVSAASLPLPAGAATAANQATANTSLAAIDTKLAGTLATAPVAGENHIGAMGGHTPTVDVILTLDTAIYASGDVLADTQTIANVFRVVNGTGIIQSIHIHDEDAQGQPFDLVFLSAANSLGTENATVSMNDVSGRDVLGVVNVGSGEYRPWPNFKTVTKLNVGQPIKAIAGSRDLGLGAISLGTGTYASGTIRLRLGILQD